jgi:hypothetical protein
MLGTGQVVDLPLQVRQLVHRTHGCQVAGAAGELQAQVDCLLQEVDRFVVVVEAAVGPSD